jgi:hypothetical protein
MKIFDYKLFLFFFTMCSLNINSTEDSAAIVLPDRFLDWRVAERLDFRGQQLYDYINGGAELYISYGLTGMTGCKYESDSLPQLTAEIYEMTSAANAYGVYTQSRDIEECDFGQGSQSFPDFVLFWKGRYFVIVNTQEVTDRSAAAVRSLAALIDSLITDTGTPPDIVADIPQPNLVSAGFLYFHHYIWLNAYYFVADHNLLNINDKTDAVLAKYIDGDRRAYLLMVDYPDGAVAAVAFRQLIEKYAPELRTDAPFVQLEDRTWFAAALDGQRVVAVFNAGTREFSEKLLNTAMKNKKLT